MNKVFNIQLKFEKQYERILKRSLSFGILFIIFCIAILIFDFQAMYHNLLSKFGFMNSGILIMATIYMIFSYLLIFVDWIQTKKKITEFENIVSRHESNEWLDRINKYNENMDSMFNKYMNVNENGENTQPESGLPEKEI